MRTFKPNPNRPPLTSKQRAFVDFIRSFTADRGFPPTVRNLGDQFLIKSPNGVMCHLKALERKGYILREAKRSRAIVLIEERPTSHLPLLGMVPSCSPKDVQGMAESVDLTHLSKEEQFAVRISGDSMIDAGILAGDLVIIRPTAESIEEGQIVLAIAGGDAVLRRHYRESPTTVRLEAAHRDVPPIWAENVTVFGVMAGLIRGL